MRILDRYVLKTFLWNYLLSFGVLVGMYITLDIVMNFDELFKVTQGDSANATGFSSALRTVYYVFDYYVFQSVLIFVQLSPVIPVLATAFTLLRMTRTNETIATLAAGIPLLRTAAPIILAGVVLTGGVVVAQETLIPSIIPKLLRAHEDVGRDGRRAFPVKALEDGLGNILIAARFTPATLTAPASMLELDFIVRNDATKGMERLSPSSPAPAGPLTDSVDEHQPIAHIRAARAVWEPSKNHWRLSGGSRYGGLRGDDVSMLPADIDVLPTTLTPDEVTLYRSRQYVELLSTERINELLAAPRGYGNLDLLRVKHFRLTQYLNNNILLWLIIPCVMTREPRTLKTGGAFLLMITGAYLGTIFVCQHLAGSAAPTGQLAPYWTPLMALVSPVLFFLAAIFALDKIKT